MSRLSGVLVGLVVLGYSEMGWAQLCPDDGIDVKNAKGGGQILQLDWSNPQNQYQGDTIIFDGQVVTGAPSGNANRWESDIYPNSTFDINGCHWIVLVEASATDTCYFFDGDLQPRLSTQVLDTADASCSSVCDGTIQFVADLCDGDCYYELYDGNNNLIASGTSKNGRVVNLSGLCADTYTLVVYNSDNVARRCQSRTYSIPVGEPPPLTASIIDIVHVQCAGACTGEAEVQASGGTPPYSYQWTDPLGQVTKRATGLCAGTDSVIVTDANGCKDTAVFTITEPPPLTCTGTVLQDVSCKGACDGQVQGSASGGTPPYSYVWQDNLGNTVSTASTATGLCAGSYTLWVTDANGCSCGPVSVTVSEPPPLSIRIDRVGESSPGACDGSATAVVSGGTPTYTVVWQDLSGNALITCSAVPAGGSCQLPNTCDADQYVVCVTDASGCTLCDTTRLIATFSFNYHCDGSCPDVVAVASGGFSPYTYEWKNGAIVVDTDDTLNCATGGTTYTFTVSDARGNTYTQDVTVTNPYPMVADITATVNVTCSGLCNGEAEVSVVGGGLAPYSYQWDDPSSQTTRRAVNLCAGTYHVIVTDSYGCKDTDTVTITEPPPLVVDAFSTACNCPGSCDGSMWVTVSGGTPGYTYAWRDASNNVVATTQTVTNVCAGNYTVTVTDANNCSASDVIAVTEPPPITVTVTRLQCATCPGEDDGRVDAKASGGNGGPYTYEWVFTLTGSVIATGNKPDLYEGNYLLVVSDNKGCRDTFSYTMCGSEVVYCPDQAWLSGGGDIVWEWTSGPQPSCMESVWLDTTDGAWSFFNRDADTKGNSQAATKGGGLGLNAINDTLVVVFGSTMCTYVNGNLSQVFALSDRIVVDARWQEEGVVVRWKLIKNTPDRIVKGYRVERSVDGFVFEEIWRMESGGAIGEEEMEFVDVNVPSTSVVYYRVVAIYGDGGRVASVPVVVSVGGVSEVAPVLWYDPAGNRLVVEPAVLEFRELILILYDVNGKMWWRLARPTGFESGKLYYTLNAPLPRGVYLVVGVSGHYSYRWKLVVGP